MTTDAEELWGRTLATVRDRIGSPGARAWVEGTRPVSVSADTMVLAAPSEFARQWLKTRYETTLTAALAEAAGRPLALEVTVESSMAEGANAPGAISDEPANLQVSAPHRPPTPPQLNPRYQFDTFVTGPSNRFAHAAARAVAEQPARSYNPLFIYGAAGLGKTHLAHAIGHEVCRLYPNALVRYVSSERFMNEFIRSVREERMQQFRATYREADVLLVDDIQFLARGEQTQEEFFHTFNALHNDNKQIVITSDRVPKEIPTLEDRLRTRFEWGLMIDVQPPDLETRVAILQKKASAEHFRVPNDVLEYIAQQVQNNIRELEGLLVRVVAFGSLSGSPLSVKLAQEVLQPVLPSEDSSEIPADLIINECSKYFGIERTDLLGPSRSRQFVNARQIAMYLCRELTPLSLPKIGGIFGGRDHTTVMHAESKIRQLMGERRQVYQQVQELTARIRGRVSKARR